MIIWPTAPMSPVIRVQVQRNEVNAGTNPTVGDCSENGSPIEREPVKLQTNDIQVPGMRPVRSVVRQFQEVCGSGGLELPRISRRDRPTGRKQFRGPLKLDQTQRCSDIGHVVLVA